MKLRAILCASAAAVLAAALLAFTKCDREPADSSGGPPPHDPDGTRHHSGRPPSPDPDTHVTFPGLPPVRISEKKTGVLKDLAKSCGPFDDLKDWFQWAFENQEIEIQTDDTGAIALIKANENLLPSISRKSEVPALFAQDGIEIVRLGNPVANVNNKLFMQALVHAFEFDRSLVSAEFDENLQKHIYAPAVPHLIYPITYLDRTPDVHGGPPRNPPEKYGLLWMTKNDLLPDAIAYTRWEREIPRSEARWVEWEIIPLPPRTAPPEPDAKEWWGIIDYANVIRTPDFTFERKIRRPGDPPDTPQPPPDFTRGGSGLDRDNWIKAEKERVLREWEEREKAFGNENPVPPK